MDKIKHIPLNQIETTALPRDRTLIDTNALDELTASIRTNGLRLPIEVYPTDTGFALIAGYRRHLAFQTLAQSDNTFAKIPAFIRTPKSMPNALAAMIEENEMRQSLSPWERAHIIVLSVDLGTFETVDDAIKTLYPHATRQKRAKLRAITDVIWELSNHLTDPEILTERQLMRLSNAIRHDWTEILKTALSELNGLDVRQQWGRIHTNTNRTRRPDRQQPTHHIKQPTAQHHPTRGDHSPPRAHPIRLHPPYFRPQSDRDVDEQCVGRD